VQQNKVGEPKSFKLFGHFSFIILISSAALVADSFSDFKQSQQTSFTNYKSEADKEFSGYLKADWEQYKAKMSRTLYEKPKPQKIDIVSEKKAPSIGPKVYLKIPKTLPKMEKPKKILEQKVIQKNTVFDFYGAKLGFNVAASLKEIRFYPYNQEGIANYFDAISSNKYESLLEEVRRYKKDLLLNDWGVYKLVEYCAKTIYNNNDEAKLFTWFMLNKLGYDVKVGLNGKNIILMHYSKKIIYNTPVYTFNKMKYYVVSHYAKGRVGSVYTYAQNYPSANKGLDLSLDTLPLLPMKKTLKVLSFTQYGTSYTTKFEYNQNLIDFMATYPQAEYDVFFNAPVEAQVYNAIAKDLKKYIDGKHASDAMNFVLNFVQKAFKYQVDDLQFGREKVMFAEETLVYDKSDCEDRAILFSYLVKKLFHVGAVGVKYKDHMSTALYIPIEGDSVKVANRRFVIADPTYINANIGQNMPQYRKIYPERFILVKGK